MAMELSAPGATPFRTTPKGKSAAAPVVFATYPLGSIFTAAPIELLRSSAER